MENQLNLDKELNNIIDYVCKKWEKYDISEINQLICYIWHQAIKKDLSALSNISNEIFPEDAYKYISKTYLSSLKIRPKYWNSLAKDYQLGNGLNEYSSSQEEEDKEQCYISAIDNIPFYKQISLPHIMYEHTITKSPPLSLLANAIYKQALLTKALNEGFCCSAKVVKRLI